MNPTDTSKYKQSTDYFRHNGAGEMPAFAAADFLQAVRLSLGRVQS
jgi:hypothetical protein